MNSVEHSKNNPGAFRVVMIVSVFVFLSAIIFGFLHRAISPVELNLDESEYIDRVFVESETSAWRQPEKTSVIIGSYNAGSILFVVDEVDDFYLVRPLIVSKVDSVWVLKDSTTSYSRPDYERWLYEEERRKFDLD